MGSHQKGDQLTVVYLAGPMAGRPGHGYDAFQKATDKLESSGTPYLVLSPHKGAPSLTQIERAMQLADTDDFHDTHLYAEMMRRDVALILMSDIVFTLPEWYMSTGACFEVELAKMVGIQVADGSDLIQD